MAKRKLSALVQAITNFNQLDERDRLTLAEYIRVQTSAPRKASTKKAAPAQKESAPEKKPSDALCVANVPTLNVPCGEREDSAFHDPSGGYSSFHVFEPPKSVVRAGRKSKPKEAHTLSVPSTANEGQGAIAVGASGD